MDAKQKAEAEAWGFDLDELGGEPIIVWPENIRVFFLFHAMRTQWRMSMNGPTGLDYNVLPEMWRRLKVPPQDRDATFADLQVIEGAALTAMHENTST